MPVLVTSAHRPFARQLALRLLEEGGEVRAYSHGDTSSLRAAGAFVAHGAPDDEGHLEAALADVHTLVHVGSGVLSRNPAADVAHVEVMLSAAANAGVSRIIALSLPEPAADADTLRRVKHEVERRVEQAPIPSIVLRTSLMDTPSLRDAIVTASITSATTIAPVQPGDVAELVVAFDAARSRADRGHLVAAADGPRRLTLDEWMQPERASRGLVGRRLASPESVEVLRSALDGRWFSHDHAVVDAWRFAGIEPRPPAGVDERDS